MQISFSGISYHFKPLIWEYHEASNQASCLFISADRKYPLNPKEVLIELRRKNYPGVTVSHDLAIITDVFEFVKRYPMVIDIEQQPPTTPHLHIPKLDMPKIDNSTSSQERAKNNSPRGTNSPKSAQDIEHESPKTPGRKSGGISPRHLLSRLVHGAPSSTHREEEPPVVPPLPPLYKETLRSPRIKPTPSRSTSLFEVYPQLKGTPRSYKVENSTIPDSSIFLSLSSTPNDADLPHPLLPESSLDTAFSPIDGIHHSIKDESLNLAAKGASSSSCSIKADFSSISLAKLIPNPEEKYADPGAWSDTVAYEDYFANKTAIDASARKEICLKSIVSFYAMNQYISNEALYPIKSQLIKCIRTLLDEHLNPLFEQWAKDTHAPTELRKSVYYYFRQAVHSAMLSNKFSTLPTEFEAMSEGAVHARFNGNQALFDYTNQAAHLLRAKTKLHRFFILIDNNMPVELIDSKEIVDSLKWFKCELNGRKDIRCRLKSIFTHMQLLIIQIGKIESKNNALTSTLTNQLERQEAIINGYSSFHHLILNWLEQYLLKTPKKGELTLKPHCRAIANQTAVETISAISECFGPVPEPLYMARLKKGIDSNFYLSKDWYEEIKEKCPEALLKKLIRFPENPKVINEFAQGTAELVVQTMAIMLNQLPRQNPEPVNASSSSMPQGM